MGQENLDAQVRAIREYCSRHNMLLVRTYEDAAMTGTNDKKDQFLKMIEDCKSGEFDAVIVHKLDRFSRDRYDSAFYKRELRKNKVQLFSVLENLDNLPESVIMESVLEGMAEYYSKNLAREVQKGMKENALKGLTIGGRPAFGYKLDPATKKFEIDETEAPGVRLIFRRILEGSYYGQIIKELNDLGYRTKMGGIFVRNSVHTILTNEKYKGVYVFNKSSPKSYDGTRNSHSFKPNEDIIRIEGGVPAIIDKQTFDSVQAIMKSRKQSKQHGNAKETYLLSGKIECGECGGSYVGARKFSGRNKKLHVTYKCSKRERSKGICCKNSEIRREYIEAFVLDRISEIVFNDDFGKVSRNRVYGIRTKWTLADDRVWDRTHNFAKYSVSFGSIFALTSVFLLQGGWKYLSIVIVIISLLIPVFYSYFFYKNLHN
jgi:site-specific DNA recombinase